MLPRQIDGQTCVLVAIDGCLAATIALFDPLKAEARGVVSALHQRGIRCTFYRVNMRCPQELELNFLRPYIVL